MIAMAVKPENTFRASVHKYLPADLHHEKMNNDYSSGTADDWYSGSLDDLWVEYKYLPRVPQRGTVHLCKPNVKKPMLSRLQKEWLRGRSTEGRNVHVIVGCPLGGVILSCLEWENPIPAADFAARVLSRKELAHWIIRQTIG